MKMHKTQTETNTSRANILYCNWVRYRLKGIDRTIQWMEIKTAMEERGLTKHEIRMS